MGQPVEVRVFSTAPDEVEVMKTNIYTPEILSLASNITRVGLLPDADALSRKQSNICGSIVLVSIKKQGNIVSDYGHEIAACALGQASAALLAKHIIGSEPHEISTLRLHINQMLATKMQPDWGRFSEFSVLHCACDYPQRFGAILLPFFAVIDCFQQLE